MSDQPPSWDGSWQAPPPGPQPPPGYQTPGYQTPGYQTPPGYQPYGGWAPGQWGGAVVQRDHPRATAVLVLGILSLVLGLSCYGVGLFMGPIAWAMGSSAIKEIDAEPGVFRNRGLVSAGRICGIVATVLLVLAVVVFVGFVALVWSSPTWG